MTSILQVHMCIYKHLKINVMYLIEKKILINDNVDHREIRKPSQIVDILLGCKLDHNICKFRFNWLFSTLTTRCAPFKTILWCGNGLPVICIHAAEKNLLQLDRESSYLARTLRRILIGYNTLVHFVTI